MAQKLISKSFRTAPGCHIRRVEMRKDGAVVGYDCGGGGSGDFPSVGGGRGNYPEALVKGVRRVSIGGAHIYTPATMGFELSPRHVKCSKKASDDVLRCVPYNQYGPMLLGGSRRRKRR